MNYIKIYVNSDGTIRRDLQEETPIFQYSTSNTLKFISPINPLNYVVYAVIELANGIVLPAKLMDFQLEEETIDGNTWYVWEWQLTSAATSSVLKNQASSLWVSFYFEEYSDLNVLLNTQTTEKTELVINPSNVASIDPIDDETIQQFQMQLNSFNTLVKGVYSKPELDLIIANVRQTVVEVEELQNLDNQVIKRNGSTTMDLNYTPENAKDVIVKDWIDQQIANLVSGQVGFNLLQFEEIEALNMTDVIEESHRHNHDDKYQKIGEGLTCVTLTDYELNVTVNL